MGLSILSVNTNLPWDENLIDKFIDMWDWEKLSFNHNLPLDEVLIDKYFDKWNWKGLSSEQCNYLNLKINK